MSLGAALARAAEHTIPRLPQWLDRPISRIGGALAYRIAAGPREAVRKNLAIVAPERSDREQLVEATFVEQVRHYLELFRLAHLDREALKRAIVVSGWETVVRAVERGNGVVFASAHIGPVSVCGQIFVLNGLEVTLPVERDTNELSRAVNRARRSMGLHVVSTDSAITLVRVLKRAGIVGMLADRAVTGAGERVPFFGQEALLPSAHVVLALRTGATLVPGFAHHDGRTMRAVFEPELELQRTGDHEADLRAGMRQWASVLERHVRQTPEQWSVFEPFWER